MTIYTLGYTGWKIDEVAAVVDRLDAVLVDVRMSPRSRNPIWNSGALAKRFGDRYVWLRHFGNRNYKGTFDQVEIVDFAGGAKSLVELFPPRTCATASGPSASSGPTCLPILLCGCPDVNQCHRKILAEGLAKLWSANIAHLRRPDSRISSGQPTLF